MKNKTRFQVRPMLEISNEGLIEILCEVKKWVLSENIFLPLEYKGAFKELLQSHLLSGQEELKRKKCSHTVKVFDPVKVKMVCANCGFEDDDF